MSASRYCGCAICSTERSLEQHLSTPQGQGAYAFLRADRPPLVSFTSASSLLVFLRSMRHGNGSGEASDKIFRALREGLGKPGGIAEMLILLALVPVLHATVSSFARTYPMLDREELSQQAIAHLIVLANSEDWRRHETHLAFSLARELRRGFSLWVQREARLFPESSHGSTPERAISAAELFERDVELKHFLARSVRSGALNKDDLHLLIEFKLEGAIEESRNGPASNAVRQRMKRLLSKMRRHESGRC